MRLDAKQGAPLLCHSTPGSCLGRIKRLIKAHSRSLGFARDDKKRVESCVIPLKPKYGLNGAPSLRCRLSKLISLPTRRRESPPIWIVESSPSGCIRIHYKGFTCGLKPAPCKDQVFFLQDPREAGWFLHPYICIRAGEARISLPWSPERCVR